MVQSTHVQYVHVCLHNTYTKGLLVHRNKANLVQPFTASKAARSLSLEPPPASVHPPRQHQILSPHCQHSSQAPEGLGTLQEGVSGSGVGGSAELWGLACALLELSRPLLALPEACRGDIFYGPLAGNDIKKTDFDENND